MGKKLNMPVFASLSMSHIVNVRLENSNSSRLYSAFSALLLACWLIALLELM